MGPGVEGLDVAWLLGELTLEEKASLCLGSDFWHTAPVARLEIPAVRLADGPHGVRREPDDVVQGSLAGALPATCFPTASALGSSWDVDLLRRVGEALGREARALDVAVLLGPGVNIKRSPLCGRNFEYLSEDPLLSGALGAALVEGIQSQGVGACVKHFAVNNQETDRARVSADVDERTLREIYLPAFERVVTSARPWTVMCSYNRVNGTYASQHPWLLTTVLRDEWGYDGLVMSDWGAVHDRVAAVAAGLDLEMPPQLGWSDVAIVDAVRSGDLDEALLDVAVERVLRLVDGAQVRAPVRAPDRPGGAVDLDAHHALARAAACESAVLLKNDDALLPLRPAAGQRVAVVGELARTPRYQGAGSSQVSPTRLDVPLEELRAAVPEGVEVGFAPGYALEDLTADSDELTSEAVALVEEAVELAGSADVVVVFAGLPAAEESEGFDRSHLHLPYWQLELIAGVGEVHDRVVVVLANGSVVVTSPWQQHAGAILECWLSGQAAGGAVADLLLGVESPSGRLAETIPVQLEDSPSFLHFPGDSGHVRYGEGLFVGYRGHDASWGPVGFPFGHGLTYTTFEYGRASVELTGSHADGTLRLAVSCPVTNTGERAGVEVVQLYVHDTESSVRRPLRELKGFTRLVLEPQQTGTAEFVLIARDLSFWSESLGDWVLEAGDFELAVGASSRDLRTGCHVHVDAPRVAPPLGPMSSLEEWLADPVGRSALVGLLGGGGDGPPGVLGEPGLLKVIGNFPMSMLAGFGSAGFDHPALERLVARVRAGTST